MDGQQSSSRASCVRSVGTAPAQDLCGNTLDMWLPVLWSEACGLCNAAWPGPCPGLGEGLGTLGDPGQLEAAGEAMLWEAGKGLPSIWPGNRRINIKNKHVLFVVQLGTPIILQFSKWKLSSFLTYTCFFIVSFKQ